MRSVLFALSKLGFRIVPKPSFSFLHPDWIGNFVECKPSALRGGEDWAPFPQASPLSAKVLKVVFENYYGM